MKTTSHLPGGWEAVFIVHNCNKIPDFCVNVLHLTRVSRSNRDSTRGTVIRNRACAKVFEVPSL